MFVVQKSGIFVLQVTVNWMGVEEKGNVYLVSVEVPAGTEEKSYGEDGVDLYVNCDGVCVRISLCLHTCTSLHVSKYTCDSVVRGMCVYEGVYCEGVCVRISLCLHTSPHVSTYTCVVGCCDVDVGA